MVSELRAANGLAVGHRLGAACPSRATLGLSKALSQIVLNFLTIGQLVSCVILLVPSSTIPLDS